MPAESYSVGLQAPRPIVLIVDDDEGMRTTTSAALEDCQTTVVARAAEALEHLAQAAFDVVVCDLVMPVMTGAELYESLPPDSPIRRRFLFMTGGALPRSIQSFLALVPVPVLAKPFRVEELREAVAAVMASSSDFL